MGELLKMLSTAHEAKRLYDELLLRANVKDSGEARISASLCLTIAEQYAATVCLIEGGFSSHAPIVVRSMLEGLANLINLVNNAAYLDQIRYENARSDVVLFEEYAAVPCLPAEAIANLSAWKDQAQPIRDELAAKNFRKQDVIEKFRLANMVENYVAYRVLCSFTHNQLTTLLARHAGKFLHYHFEAPIETTESMLAIALSILSRAIDLLPKFTDLPTDDVKKEIDSVDAMWNAIRNGKNDAVESP